MIDILYAILSKAELFRFQFEMDFLNLDGNFTEVHL